MTAEHTTLPSPATARTSLGSPCPSVSLKKARLQRKCACGGTAGSGGECEGCRKKRLQRKAALSGRGQRNNLRAPAAVTEVLRSPGQPLDHSTRDFMESRFGHDFSQVRVHTDAAAAASARAVQASAYAVGRDLVFASGEYAPQTPSGRRLLGHELAHVLQQRALPTQTHDLRISDPADPAELEADRMADRVMTGEDRTANRAGAPLTAAPTPSPVLARRVVASKVHCTAGQHGAPAHPVATLAGWEDHAKGLAQATAILTEVASASVSMGIDISTSPVGQSYQRRFGLPPAVHGGFRNRLNGRVERTRNDAISGELDLLSNRYQRIANNFERDIHYGCIHGHATYMGCSGHCTGRDATACAGIRAILICPRFWHLAANSPETLLIHESSHMLWANVLHAANYRHASCYADLVADIFNAPTTTPPCPAPHP